MSSGRMSEDFELPATPRVLDLAEAQRVIHYRDESGKMRFFIEDDRPTTNADDGSQPVLRGGAREGTVMTAKQIRARNRRRAKRNLALTDKQFELGFKPIEEWDADELARGRPRNAKGNFGGRPPKYVTREVHERATELFKEGLRGNMNALTNKAIKLVERILDDEEVDEKGKPLTPASTKLDASKWLIEHVIGKAVQPTTSEVSVKLQGILGAVMVNPEELQVPNQLEGYKPAHTGGRGEIIMTPDNRGIFSPEDEEEDDDE